MSDETASSGANQLDLDPARLVDVVLDWLEPRLPAGPALGRAIALNLAPFLIGWATANGLGAQKRPTAQAGFLETVRRGVRELRQHLEDMPEDVAEPGRDVGHVDLLAICLQPNATRSFLPVASRLRQEGVRVRLLCDYADGHSRTLALAKGVPFCTTPPLGRLEIWPTFATTALGLRCLWKDRSGLSELALALGLSSRRENLVASLSLRLRREVLRSALQASAIDSALRQLPAANVLFITNRALLNHLLFDTHPHARRFFFLQGVVPDIPPIRTKLDVDHALIGSEIDLPYVLRCGIDRSNISVTGYPDCDGYAGLDRALCRAEVDARFPRAAGRKLVVFTSQYKTGAFPDEARTKNLETLLDCARRMPSATFIVKLHPRREEWAPVGLPDNVSLERHADTPRLIKAADVLVTYWSTTALEALLLGTPLVQLNATGLPDYFDLSTRRGRSIARNAAELETLLANVRASEENRTSALRELGVVMDGKATDRSAEALLSRLKRANRG